jgi:dephospho-CoA kinase
MAAHVKSIGLTGGIGSGKSTVAQMLKDLGALVIHADAVGHEIYRPGSDGWRRVTDAFGGNIVAADGTIDRQKLGTLVFKDPAALTRLNAIVHPLMFAEIQRRIESHRASGSPQPLVLEAAVLIEANWVSLVDEVWLVVADKDAVIERVKRQRGLSGKDVTARIDAQLGDAERRRFANVVIENAGSLDELRERVNTAWARTKRAH